MFVYELLGKSTKMKPRVTFKCTNEACVQFNREVELHYSSFFASIKEEHNEDYLTARLKHCRSCYKTGDVRIQHGRRTFSDLEAFEEFIVGVAKEAKVLRKLVERGIAEPDEKGQYEESLRLIQDTKCPCCGQPLIEMVDSDATLRPAEK